VPRASEPASTVSALLLQVIGSRTPATSSGSRPSVASVHPKASACRTSRQRFGNLQAQKDYTSVSHQ